MPKLCRALPGTRIATCCSEPISNLVVVHRLREVCCLYGFTRFEAAPTAADGDLEDIRLAVHGAPLSLGADWLPAVEQFGEGLFIQFDEAAVTEWFGRSPSGIALRNFSRASCCGSGSTDRRSTTAGPLTRCCTGSRTR